jgi:hypothetical protein
LNLLSGGVIVLVLGCAQDADVPPVVPGAVVPPPPAQTQPVAGLGVQEVAPMCGDVAGVKRKGADAPELWLNDGGGDGFPVDFRATKSRRLVRALATQPISFPVLF